jgi:hypothetical protein
VIVDEHHEQVGPGRRDPTTDLATRLVEPVALLGPRDLRLARDEGRMRRERGCHDLAHRCLLRFRECTIHAPTCQARRTATHRPLTTRMAAI